MLERITDVPEGIDALAAVGTLTRQDYEQSIEPLFDEARRAGRRIRLLVEIGPDYDGYTAGAAWEKSLPKPLLATLVESGRRFGAQVQPTPELGGAFAVAFAEAGDRERWTPGRTTELRLWSRGRVLAGSPAGPGPSEHRPQVDAAEFLLLTTAEDRRYDRLRVGEALSALLLAATNAGLATMPISLDPCGGVPAPSGHPQIVVRVGWPLADGGDATRTRRRDLASVLVPPA